MLVSSRHLKKKKRKQDLSDINFCHPDDQPSLSHDSSKTSLVNSLCGLMWNVPTTPENRFVLIFIFVFFLKKKHIIQLISPNNYNHKTGAYLLETRVSL